MSWLIIILIFAVLSWVWRNQKATIKGKLGEKKIAQHLERVILEDYKVLNDIMIRTDNGTTQIDHVVICPYGILVIETKNYQGWIYGKEDSDYWTQVIYRKKFRFRNPIKQNWSHIYALKEVLKDYEEMPYYSLIVLVGSGVMKTIYDTRTKIIYPDMLYETILNCRGIQKLKGEEIEKIYQLLKSISLDDSKSRKEHIKQINQKKQERKIEKESFICPKCGSQLIKRKGNFGEFMGCANFPKCRYTVKI